MTESRLLAHELYGLLRELDPAAWGEELEWMTRQKLNKIHLRLTHLLQRDEPAWQPPLMAVLHQRLSALASQLELAPPDEVGTQLGVAWNQFRISVMPSYEALAESLHALDIHVPSLRPTNYARNIFHVGWGLVVIGLVRFVVPQSLMLPVALAAAAGAWTLETTRRLCPPVNRMCMWILGRFAHPHEVWRVNSATWYVTALCGLAAIGAKWRTMRIDRHQGKVADDAD